MADFSEQEMFRDLARADAEGNTEAATRIADQIRSQRATAQERDRLRASLDKELTNEGGLTNTFTGMGKWLSDKGLAAQQAAEDIGIGGVTQKVLSPFGLGFGDKKALAAEAADREQRDKPLMDTVGGKVGYYGTDIASTFLPMSLATKAANATKILPSGVRAVAPSVVTGAAQSALTPEKDYDLGKQLATGAVGGLAGDLVGRGVGRVLNPRLGSSNQRIVDEHLAELRGMPSLLAENLTDNKGVKTLTNTLAQLGPAGAGVNRSRAANLGAMTEEFTGAAGNRVSSLTPSEGRKLMDALTTQIEDFKVGPRVKLHDFPNKLAPALAEVGEVASIAGGSTVPTRRAIAGTQGTPSAVAPFTRPQQGLPYPNYPAIPKSITAKEALAIRSKASDAFHSTDDWVKKEQYMLLRDEMDKAIVLSRGKQGGKDYLDWKEKYNQMKHIEKAGITKEGVILPEDFAGTLTKNQQFAPRTRLERLAVAGASRMASPSLSEPRATAIRALTAGGIGGASLFGGPLGAAGAIGTLALAHKVLGTPGGGRYLTGTTRSEAAKALQSERLREMIRMLSIYGGASGTTKMTQ